MSAETQRLARSLGVGLGEVLDARREALQGALDLLAGRDTLPLSGGRYTALQGTVRAGEIVHLDIGEVGSIDPEDKTPALALANGSIDLREEAGSDGNVQLTTVSSTGILLGPAFKDPIFSPCIPTATP
jgi:hypothetical protein